MAKVAYTAAEKQMMAYILMGEAEAQGVVGMTAVAHVIRNRAESPVFSSTGDAYEVATHQSWFDGYEHVDAVQQRVAKSKVSAALYEKALKIVDTVIVSETRPPDPTGAATHYHTVAGDAPYWAASVTTSYGTVTDGAHLFYANAPQQATFNDAAAAIDDTFKQSTPIPLDRPSDPIKQVGGVDPTRVIQTQSRVASYRKLPLSDELATVLAYTATKNGVYLEVYSGGQDPAISGTVPPGASPRHNHGNAADLKAYVLNADGSKRYLDWSKTADQKIWFNIVADAVAAGATGVGAADDYMGTMSVHIGFGGSAAWGNKATGSGPADWLAMAHAFGLTLDSPDLSLPMFAFYQNPKGTPQAINSPGYWGIEPIEDQVPITPVLEWAGDDQRSIVRVTDDITVDAYYDPDRGAFFFNEEIDNGSLDNIDQSALDYAMAAARNGSAPTDVASLYAGILPIRSEITLPDPKVTDRRPAETIARPAGAPTQTVVPALRNAISAVLPMTPLDVDKVYEGIYPINSNPAGAARPSGPAAGLPGAEYQPMVTGRPEAPVGALPASRGTPSQQTGIPALPSEIVPRLPEKYDSETGGVFSPEELKRYAATAIPMDMKADDARSTILTGGFGALLGSGPLPSTPNPVVSIVRTATQTTDAAMRNAITQLSPEQRIIKATTEKRAGVTPQPADVVIKPVPVVGEPMTTTSSGSSISVSQKLAITAVTSDVQEMIKKAAATSSSSSGGSSSVTTTVTLPDPKITDRRPAETIVRPAGTPTQTTVPALRNAISAVPAVTPAPATQTVTKTVMVPTQVPVTSYVRPEGPIGTLPAAPTVKPLGPATQTIDPAMRNAISAVNPAPVPPVPVMKPPGLQKVVTYKTVMVPKKVQVVVPVKKSQVLDEGSGKIVTVRQSPTVQTTPQTIVGSSTGKVYVVGQTYQGTNGYKYVATPTGFEKVKGSGTAGIKDTALGDKVRANSQSRNVSGDLNAFQPKSVQDSPRWQTGY